MFPRTPHFKNSAFARRTCSAHQILPVAIFAPCSPIPATASSLPAGVVLRPFRSLATTAFSSSLDSRITCITMHNSLGYIFTQLDCIYELMFNYAASQKICACIFHSPRPLAQRTGRPPRPLLNHPTVSDNDPPSEYCSLDAMECGFCHWSFGLRHSSFS
jgi:hypothetical protein